MDEQKASVPRAPRDAEKKRKSFYIMRNKQVAGSPRADGSGVQVIFISEERLVSFARIAGGITDDGILELLRTAEGFRRLVYGLGVSVETEDPGEMTAFVLQMYGKTDPGITGTQFRREVQADGMEYMIRLSQVDWSEDDATPGQIRFEFSRANTQARVSVRLYLQDGYDAPEPEEEDGAVLKGPVYGKMLERSLLGTGDLSRLKRVMEKARAGEETRVAFIGGSITQGAGAVPINEQCYAWKTFQGFCGLCGRGTEDNIHFGKAGVGGSS
ncbi:MAG: SGNH/GDSL hydrolase family protein, partial [Acetatifactor sp.]|nr:SGNH/GDSL hydrolase family protein [Acetatifactor sp.]